MALLDGGQPSVLAVGGGQDAAWDAVGAVEVGSHLLLKILEAVKAQGLIEPLVVVTVASFHLAVMSRRSRLDQLVSDAVVPAESVHRVEPVGLSDVGKLRSVVGLDRLRDIPEVPKGFSDEVDCAVAALLPVGADKPLSACLVNNGVLVELYGKRIFSDIAFCRDILDIHLPFYADRFRGVVLFWLVRFTDCLAFVVPHSAQQAIEADEMPTVASALQLAVQLVQTDARIPPNQPQDQVDLLCRVCVWMYRVRAAGAVFQ